MGALYEKAQGPDLRLVHPSTSALLLTALLATLSDSASELVCPSCMLGEICLRLWAPMTGSSFMGLELTNSCTPGRRRWHLALVCVSLAVGCPPRAGG